MPKNINTEVEKARIEIKRLQEENLELRGRLGLAVAEPAAVCEVREPELPLTDQPLPSVTNASSVEEKVALFRALFRGREDVYASFWVNQWTGKKGYSPACEGSLRKGLHRKYLPLTNEVIQEHLAGEKTIGSFPLLKDNACQFLACDFDKEGWKLDALAFLEVCKKYGIPACLERSRSGNGGHVWIFFSSPVPAVSARQLGMRILRQTMDVRADMDLGSYDRFFPSQDFVPRGGFGNLIALPLQKKCRALGNTEFLDPDTSSLHPYRDQWTFLSGVQRIAPAQLEALLEAVTPVAIGPGKAGRTSEAFRAKSPPPKQIRCEYGASFSIEKSGIPPWMLSRLKHLASLHNPEFYLLQKLRRSTYRTPRFIKCYREDFCHIHMPRGTSWEVEEIIREAGSGLILTDSRSTPKSLPLRFCGTLTSQQEKAVQIVLSHDMGVLVAPPGAGKTVMGCFMVAERSLPTLILAHRKPILEQWRKQVMEILGLTSRQIGQIGGGKNTQTGIVDLGMLQSLAGLEDPAFFSKYGFIIVDECHHVPAPTFEACMREASVRYVLGLTATPYRRDGLQDIITMQCGPIRHKVCALKCNLTLRLKVRETDFAYLMEENTPIQDVFRALVQDEARNALIERDVLDALSRGRRCLILSNWKEHCQLLADRLVRKGKSPFVLRGNQGKKERTVIFKAIQETPPEKDLVVIATGQYLGEGFDCPQLDTLFLVFPVSFKGKLIQHVGRILREHPLKTTALVYDYLDSQAPVLKRMYDRRARVYKTQGFTDSKGRECFASSGKTDP